MLRAARFANALGGSRVPGWSRECRGPSARVAAVTPTLKYFRCPSSRVAPGTRTLKYFQSGDHAACGPLRQCMGRLAGPWEESRVPRLLTQGCFSHSDSEDFRGPSSRVAPGTRTLKYFRCPSARVACATR